MKIALKYKSNTISIEPKTLIEVLDEFGLYWEVVNHNIIIHGETKNILLGAEFVE